MKVRYKVCLLALCGLLAGCPSSTPKPAQPEPDPEPVVVPAAFEPAALLTGDWSAAAYGTMLSWLRPGRPDAAIYGVSLIDPPSVWVIDDEAEGALRLSLYDPGAPAARVCDHDAAQPEGLWFACDDDAGGTLRYWQNGDQLDYEISMLTAGPFTYHHSPIEVAAAPECEDADRAFDAGTHAGGVTAWVEWFAEDGVMWGAANPYVGREAIATAMTDVLKDTDLRWKPTVSRLGGDGKLGITAGTFEASGRSDGKVTSSGSYVTVWRKDPEGWRVIFDAGRPDPS